MNDRNYPDYMDVKEVSEVVDELRGRTMHMIWHYKGWRKRRAAVLLKSAYLLMEDDLLRSQIRETFHLYKILQGEYRDMHRRCLAGIARERDTRYGTGGRGEEQCA